MEISSVLTTLTQRYHNVCIYLITHEGNNTQPYFLLPKTKTISYSYHGRTYSSKLYLQTKRTANKEFEMYFLYIKVPIELSTNYDELIKEIVLVDRTIDVFCSGSGRCLKTLNIATRNEEDLCLYLFFQKKSSSMLDKLIGFIVVLLVIGIMFYYFC